MSFCRFLTIVQYQVPRVVVCSCNCWNVFIVVVGFFFFWYQVAAWCSFIAMFHFFLLTTIFHFIARYFARVEECLPLVTLEIACVNPYMENLTCLADLKVEDFGVEGVDAIVNIDCEIMVEEHKPSII